MQVRILITFVVAFMILSFSVVMANFERSNSQGLNLSFTDIITAKIYIDFKLTQNIADAVRTCKYFNENPFSDEHLQIRWVMMAKSELQEGTTDEEASKALHD